MTTGLERIATALAGRYRIERELGRGGMAIVFLAEDLKHHRPVAVKVLDPELAAAIGPDRFLREIEVTARLDHPHILPLLDSGAAVGLLYYVMPYVEGESLRERLAREKQLALDDALRIAREVADALGYAHGRGVVHRDIKPENVMLAAGHARVSDFGIARAITVAGSGMGTGTGVTLGTPAYMSPEQAAGSRDIDGRSDVYSLGCMLFEMLAGQPPFTGATVESVIHQHLVQRAPSITTLRPAVPGWVASALDRALAKTPADRFPDAVRFAEALARTESPAGIAAAPAPAATPRRRDGRTALFAGAAVALVAAGILLIVRARHEEPAPGERPREGTAIAVLPFENLSADPAHAYFAGGLHDELLTQLSKVAALRVISRTSVMGYAGARVPLRRIARELGVGSVVEGSVQVIGGRLRVNVQLIDAATDAHRWAERYDRTLDDAFAVQSDVAQRIVAAVGVALGASEQMLIADAPTANAEAYRIYLQGRDYYRRPGFTREDKESEQRLYERALALDPGFALAHAALSEAHGFMHWFRYDFSPARIRLQHAEAETALRLAPDLPQAHVAMGIMHYWGRRDYARALQEFGVALRGLPNDAQIWAWVGFVSRRSGKWSDAFDAFDRATLLNPRDANLFSDLGGHTFRAVRRYSDAVRAFDRALVLAPNLHRAAVDRAWTFFIWHGELDTLREVLSHVPPDAALGRIEVRGHRAELLLLEGQVDSLLAFVASTPERVFEGQDAYVPTSLFAAWAHQRAGDGQAARAAFEAARVLLDSAIVDLPDDWRVHHARGLALAGLGHRGAALEEARWIERSADYRDAFRGTATERAAILAQAGERKAALDEIERLLASPADLSVHQLRLHPVWDPIREDPRFRSLLARYAQP